MNVALLLSICFRAEFSSFPFSLYFNIVAVGQLLILLFSIPVSFQFVCHLCTLPFLASSQSRGGFVFTYPSVPLSAPLPLLYLQTCLLFLWTWPPPPGTMSLASKAMECSEEAFLSLIAARSHHPPKYLNTNKVPMATSKQAAHKATLYVLYDLTDDIRTSCHVPFSALFSNVSSHPWKILHKNTARQQICIIY